MYSKTSYNHREYIDHNLGIKERIQAFLLRGFSQKGPDPLQELNEEKVLTILHCKTNTNLESEIWTLLKKRSGMHIA